MFRNTLNFHICKVLFFNYVPSVFAIEIKNDGINLDAQLNGIGIQRIAGFWCLFWCFPDLAVFNFIIVCIGYIFTQFLK